VLFRRLALSLFLLITTGVVGAQDPQYLVEYRAYAKAVEQGDAATAEKHAHAAWLSSEEELGDHRLTAILAFNYGRQILFGDSENAAIALKRASNLQAAGVADLPPDELRLYVAYIELITEKNSRRNAKELGEALDRIESQDLDLGSDLAVMRLTLATFDFIGERYREAIESAAKAETAIRAAAPGNYRSLATTMIVKGGAHLVPHPRRKAQILDAQIEFDRARRMFPPQKSIDEFDILLGQAIAWDAAADASLKAISKSGLPDHDDRHQRKDGSDSLPPLFVRKERPQGGCGEVQWQTKTPPKYPKDAVRNGYIGAVLIGFDIGDDLKPSNAKILAEVPARQFGDAALKAIDGWQAQPSSIIHPACRQNRLAKFMFVIER
jgi:tetratricopeptide (TPR) repeat protein